MPRRPTFPTASDLPHLTPAEARAALEQLRRICKRGAAEVYTAAGSHDTRWNVWLPRTNQRIELQRWASEWLVTWRKPGSPDDDGGAE